jgi:plasmid stabilization system protein ParE
VKRLIWSPRAVADLEAVGQPTPRELIVRPYRLIYRQRGEAIEIVTVFHGARMFRDLRR